MANQRDSLDLLIDDGLRISAGYYSSFMFGDDNYKNNVPHDYFLSLLRGEWGDFINPDELIKYKELFEKNSDYFFKILNAPNTKLELSLIKKNSKQKNREEDDASLGVEASDEFSDAFRDYMNNYPLYKDKFNSDWNMAVTIQAVFWYRKYLEEIDYAELESLYWNAPNVKLDIDHNYFEKQLERQNDGYLLMLDMRQAYLDEFEVAPSWSVLMDYIGENPWSGGEVKVIRTGDKVKSISIQGLARPLTRESFRHRFNRYFKNPD